MSLLTKCFVFATVVSMVWLVYVLIKLFTAEDLGGVAYLLDALRAGVVTAITLSLAVISACADAGRGYWKNSRDDQPPG